MYIEWFVMRLIVEDGECRGVVAYDIVRGGFEEFRGDAVIMATGGAGRTYSNTTNAVISTGFGAAMAYHDGVPLKDMEFVQFHPTGLYTTHILMTEGCRGEGGYLLNDLGERFMLKYAPSAGELAPRDITSRSIQQEIDAGRGIGGKDFVYLDLRHLGARSSRSACPALATWRSTSRALTPVYEPIPIQPCQHYSMGGMDTDVDGKTRLPNFWAAGECACVSVHGANRLGATRLLETIVFGRRAGRSAVRPPAGRRCHRRGCGQRHLGQGRVGHGGRGRRRGRPPRHRGRVRHTRRDDGRHALPLRHLSRGGAHEGGHQMLSALRRRLQEHGSASPAASGTST